MATPQYLVRAVGSGGQLDINVLSPDDNVGYAFGTDSDAVFYLSSALIEAADETTGLHAGTSVKQETAANSLIISNITDDGDIQMLVNDGGNSKEFLFANGDTADLVLGHGMATATVKTASGALTLAPGGNIVASSAVDIQGGYANSGGAPYDGVVDAGGGGNWTTLAAGETALGDAGSYTMLVKAGTYSTTSATITFSTNNAKIVVEPGTTIVDPITLSGNNITLVLGAGCDMDGLITLSGDNCSLLCENGVDLDGITSSGDYNTIDGGGWDTISYVASGQSAISFAWSTGTVVQNISAQEPTSNSYSAITLAGTKHRAINCRSIEGGGSGISISATSNENYVAHCRVDNSEEASFLSKGPRNLFVGNLGFNAGTMGFQISDTGDNTVVVGNIIEGQAGDSVDINDAGVNCVVVGNRLDGAVDAGDGGSTVANNETDAF